MHHERNTGARSGLDDGEAIREGRRERLLHDRREFSRLRRADELACDSIVVAMSTKSSCSRAEHFGRVSRKLRSQPVTLRGGAGFFKIEIADGREDDVVHARPRRQMVFGKEAAADEADPEWSRVHAILRRRG